MRVGRVAGKGLMAMAKGLRSLSYGSHQPEVQKAIGEKTVELVKEGIEAGEGPDGEAWIKRYDGGAPLLPLAEHVEYRPLPPNDRECAVEVRVNHWTAHFAQRGTMQHGEVHNPERPIVPEDQPSAAWMAKLRTTAGISFQAAVKRAVKGK